MTPEDERQSQMQWQLGLTVTVDWQDGVSIMGCLDAYTPAICIEDEVTVADHAVTHARKGGTSSLRALHEIFHFDMSEP
jgi:hypothetical protein